MKTRTKLYCAAGTLAALTGFYLLGARESPAQPAQVAQHPAHVSGSQRPAQPAGGVDTARCAQALNSAALVINQVDVGRFDNPYDVCPGTHAQVLAEIRGVAAQLAKLPR